MNATTGARKPWLFGPVPDLLWGSGLAYHFVFVMLLVAATQVRTLFPPWALLLAVVFLSMPHYGATILRAYEKREDRRAYMLFTVYTTILLAMAFYFFVRGSSTRGGKCRRFPPLVYFDSHSNQTSELWPTRPGGAASSDRIQDCVNLRPNVFSQNSKIASASASPTRNTEHGMGEAHPGLTA